MANGRAILSKVRHGVSRGVSSVSITIQKQKAAAAKRAAEKAAKEAVAIERERVKAEEEHKHQLSLRRMYEARAKVLQERESVKKARIASGSLTVGEKLSRAFKGGGKAASSFYGGLEKFYDRPRKSSGRPKRRSTTKSTGRSRR